MDFGLYRLVYEDRLLSVWENRSPLVRERVIRGKRVPAKCLLTAAERKIYVKSGAVKCIKALMEGRKLGLADAAKLLNEARGGSYKEWKAKMRPIY